MAHVKSWTSGGFRRGTTAYVKNDMIRTGLQHWLTASILTAVLCLGSATDAKDHPVGRPLTGKNYDYDYDGRDVGHPERAWLGRAYVPKAASEKGKARPLVVFLHGLNAALIKYRWMGGGKEGDVRRMIDGLVTKGRIEPVVVAAPSSVIASQVSKGASWNYFDLDKFVDLTIKRLKGIVRIDEKRIIVAGHSGAGCSTAGGMATVGKSRRKLLALLAIDTCMSGSLATRLGQSRPQTHVVVSYQTVSWGKRRFKLFRKLFNRQVKKTPAKKGILRELDHLRPTAKPHDATVKLTFRKWLPKIVPPAKKRPPKKK